MLRQPCHLPIVVALLVGASFGAQGCVFQLNGDLLTLRDAAADDAGLIDAAADVQDMQVTDLPVDAMGDGPPLGALVCQPPLPVGTSPVGLGEPAVRIDGLEVVANVTGTSESYRLERTKTSDPFTGTWVPYQTLLPVDSEDVTFVEAADGMEAAMLALGSVGSRKLHRCNPLPAISCPVVALNEGGASITDDVDGPTLRKLGSEFIMAFNRGNDLYVGQPIDSSLLVFDITRLDVTDATGGEDDDPTLTPDGTALIWGADDGTGSERNLWIAYRDDALTGQFSAPQVLAGVNTAEHESGPDIYAVDGDVRNLELYFMRRPPQPGLAQIYVAKCSR